MSYQCTVRHRYAQLCAKKNCYPCRAVVLTAERPLHCQFQELNWLIIHKIPAHLNFDETFLAICLSKEKCLRRRLRLQILSMHQLEELSDSTKHWGIFCFEDSKIRIGVLLKYTYTTCTVPSVFNGLLLIFPLNSCLCAWRRQLSLVVELSRWEINLICIELGNQFESNGITVFKGTCLEG